MGDAARPEIREAVFSLHRALLARPPSIPLADVAALFGASSDVLARVRTRGDLVLKGDAFSNDGPELVVPAGKIELEISDLLKGTWSAGEAGFALRFPHEDFTVRACLQVAFFRKCFGLREIRATTGSIELDFGSAVADRRYTF
ncbi:MAG TPA: hypothetical protein VFY93_09855 [Planctomycetota bacterium]|nr:hypothetical protein [Planctomycetota bacterium]